MSTCSWIREVLPGVSHHPAGVPKRGTSLKSCIISSSQLFHIRGSSGKEQFPTESKLSVSTFNPLSSLHLKEEELLHLSPDTWLLALHTASHHLWPGCLAPPEQGIRSRFLMELHRILTHGKGLAEPSPASRHYWKLMEKEQPNRTGSGWWRGTSSLGCTLRTSRPGYKGWGLEQPSLVEGVPGGRMSWTLKSLPIQTIL